MDENAADLAKVALERAGYDMQVVMDGDVVVMNAIYEGDYQFTVTISVTS